MSKEKILKVHYSIADFCRPSLVPELGSDISALTVLQGDPGEGKTSLILKIAAMLTQGQQPPTMYQGKLFESEDIDPITVFYASTEEEIADSALPRFINNGGDRSRFAYSAESSVHMNLNEEDIRSVVEQTNAKMIIIDPLQAFLPPNTSLNNVTKLRPIFTALSNVAILQSQ